MKMRTLASKEIQVISLV